MPGVKPRTTLCELSVELTLVLELLVESGLLTSVTTVEIDESVCTGRGEELRA